MKNKILLEVFTMTNSTLSLYDAILVAIKKAWTEKNPECEIEHYNDYSRACELLTKIEFEEASETERELCDTYIKAMVKDYLW